jgi:hypothetical protein
MFEQWFDDAHSQLFIISIRFIYGQSCYAVSSAHVGSNSVTQTNIPSSNSSSIADDGCSLQ